MNNTEFLPTRYDENTDIETTYRPGFPFVMRDQGSYRADELCVVVLDDIADVMEDAGTFSAEAIAAARKTAADGRRDLDAYDNDEEGAEFPEWLNDAAWHTPAGVYVDWNGEAGTVTTTVDAGWEIPA